MDLDKLEKSDREKNIDKFLNSVKTEKEWKKETKEKVKKWKKKYEKELEDYEFVYTSDELFQLKFGGYIRYINLNNELRWGGIYLKNFMSKDRTMIILANSNMKTFTISFDSNYVFYKKHVRVNDRTRKLFISLLEKYDK